MVRSSLVKGEEQASSEVKCKKKILIKYSKIRKTENNNGPDFSFAILVEN